MYFMGKCGCYDGLECYADCTCDNCHPHKFGGIVLNGVRYFRAKDIRPDNQILDTLITTYHADGKSQDPMRDHPEALVASEVAILMAKDAPRTKAKDQAASGKVPDPKVR